MPSNSIVKDRKLVPHPPPPPAPRGHARHRPHRLAKRNSAASPCEPRLYAPASHEPATPGRLFRGRRGDSAPLCFDLRPPLQESLWRRPPPTAGEGGRWAPGQALRRPQTPAPRRRRRGGTARPHPSAASSRGAARRGQVSGSRGRGGAGRAGGPGLLRGGGPSRRRAAALPAPPTPPADVAGVTAACAASRRRAPRGWAGARRPPRRRSEAPRRPPAAEAGAAGRGRGGGRGETGGPRPRAERAGDPRPSLRRRRECGAGVSRLLFYFPFFSSFFGGAAVFSEWEEVPG